MPTALEIELEDLATGLKEVVPLVFEDSEWTRLIEFVALAKALQELRILKDGLRPSLTINWRQGEGLQVAGSVPPWDDVMALMLALRPFLLSDERTNFFKVCKLIGRRIRHDAIHRFLDGQRAVFSGVRSQGLMQIKSGKVMLNSHDTLMNWLNANWYHRDQAKKAQLEWDLGPFSGSNERPLFMMLLTNVTAAVIEVANFSWFLQRKAAGESVEMRLK